MTPKILDNDKKEAPQQQNDDVGNLEGPNVAPIEFSDSESEDEDGEESMDYSGYQPLPQEPYTMESDSDSNQPDQPPTHLDQAIQDIVDSDLSESVGAVASNIFQMTEEPRDNTTSKLWNESKREDNLKIDQEKADKIKTAMAGIKLPPGGIPDWAKLIPEEQWKSNLFKKIEKDNKSEQSSSSSSSSGNT